jgi:hypothetical protein
MMTRLAWIVAVTLGLTAGGFAFHFPGSYGNSVLDPAAGLFGFLIGSVHGLVVGALIWMALRLSRPAGTRVLGAMVLIVGGTHALNDGSSTQIPFVVTEGVAGLLSAGVLAWRLGERRLVVLAVGGLAWAIGILVGGWSGDAIGLPLTETPMGWAQDHAWDGLVTGLTWGIATAAVDLPIALRRDARRVFSPVLARE